MSMLPRQKQREEPYKKRSEENRIDQMSKDQARVRVQAEPGKRRERERENVNE